MSAQNINFISQNLELPLQTEEKTKVFLKIDSFSKFFSLACYTENL